MHEENKTKSRASIALALCFCVLALTSFLAVKSSLNKISNSGMTAAENSTSHQDQEAAAGTPVIDSKDQSSDGTGDSESNAQTQETTPAATDYIMPVDGPVILKYSMSSLVYSKTLDQYMTHPGVDIATKKSTDVKVIADGTVSKVYNDDRYGTTVCIIHDNGLSSIYSNLDKHGLAEAGDQVNQGDVIGSVGDTALFESLDETHLHFAMTKDGNCVDPGEFIDGLKQ